MIEIPLTPHGVALIDEDDALLVANFKWHRDEHPGKFHGQCYAYARLRRVRGKQKNIRLHRLIMCPPTGVEVDHINHNGLDNRKANLRLCTSSQNKAAGRMGGTGKSCFRGVHWDKARSKWSTSVQVKGRMRFVGRFDDEREAARAYDRAARHHFGEFAQCNFPNE